MSIETFLLETVERKVREHDILLLKLMAHLIVLEEKIKKLEDAKERV